MKLFVYDLMKLTIMWRQQANIFNPLKEMFPANEIDENISVADARQEEK